MKSEVYTYIIEAGRELKINTPGIKDFSQIKTQAERRDEYIFRQSDYPNGWHIEIEQYSDHIVLYSNMPLKENKDGSFTAPTE